MAAEPAAARRIVKACAGLPLAIHIVGSRFLGRESWTLSDMASKLSREDCLLDELQDGDRSVYKALEAGYVAVRRHTRDSRKLDAVLRALGTLRVSWIHAASLTPILNWDVKDVATILDELLEMWLLDSPCPDEYVLNDLVRAFARRTARTHNSRQVVPHRSLYRYFDGAGSDRHSLCGRGTAPLSGDGCPGLLLVLRRRSSPRHL